MNIEFEKHIIELLKNNACVVLPGFGGFILKSVPSSIHQNTIFPPSKTIAFNQSLKFDDELLTGALMGSYGLDYSNAKNKVHRFSNQISFTLKKDQQVSLKQIGAFSVNAQNQIIFKPFLNTLVDKEAFGMSNFHIQKLQKQVLAKPLAQKQAAVKKIVEKQKEERKTSVRKKSKMPIFGMVASLLLIAGIAGLMATDTHFGNKNIQEAGFVDMFFPNDTHVVSFENISSNITEGVALPFPQKEGFDSGRIYTINQEDISSGYYIVLGSYSSLQNAERMEAKLFEEGKDSYILKAENGFYRVCEFVSKNYIDAKEVLKAKASSKKDVWLLSNSN